MKTKSIILLTIICVYFLACDGLTELFHGPKPEEPPVMYTVTFNVDGAVGTPPEKQTAETGTNINLPGRGDLTSGGNIFAGWNTQADGKGTDYAEGAVYTVTGDVTLYAKWRSGTYTVIYHANGGGGSTAPSAHIYGEEKNLNANAFTRNGYDFMGWARSESGSIEFTDGQLVENLAGKDEAEVTLYAQWRGYYMVAFNANGGSGAMPDKKFYVGETGELPANTFTSSKYFLGWAAEANGKFEYADEGNMGFSYPAIAGTTITLYALWDAIEMVWIPAGTFTMGSDDIGNAQPTHQVTLTQGFYMGKYQVTQEQWQKVMSDNTNGISATPSYFHGGSGREPASGEEQRRRPVEMVSWFDILVFCNRLSMQEGLSPTYRINGSTNPSDWGAVPNAHDVVWEAVLIVSGSTGYRLPTEAQWEYAAKGGNGSPKNYIYSGSNNANEVGWYSDNSDSMTHEVGLKQPNGIGLYDMSGNVHELCWDIIRYYTSDAKTDPIGPIPHGYGRRVRGGWWGEGVPDLLSAGRSDFIGPMGRVNWIGFRLVRP